MRFETRDWLSGGLAIIGALNWGLVGLFGFNLVHSLFGWSKPIERIIYATVGLAGLLFALDISRSTGATERIRENVQGRGSMGME